MHKPASTERIRPPMFTMKLDNPSLCDICGKYRSTKKHQACSRIRQERKNAEWATFMAEQAAAKQAKGRRYER
ncbi:MAG: hypothetical protein NDI93_01455 [Pseudomonas sp.]|nr:hypothetical protein [Pseudomonas sp.]